jgi:DNA-binding response OmpR family regulator
MNSTYRSKKALIIDHSAIITKIIKNFLTQAGFEKGNVFVAHDKNMAMMMFGLEKFDLITSGMHLRDSSGVELLKEIREQTDAGQDPIPFLAISSEKQEIYQPKLDLYPTTGYLRKPFSQDRFEESLQNILNHTDSAESAAVTPLEETSTLVLEWEESPVEIPSALIEAFTESTIEAMEQYMAEAIPEISNEPLELQGYFSGWLDLLNTDSRTQITLLVNFPKNAACNIYEGIFGEVDIEQVCGVVQELANIIGGIVKSKISDISRDILQLVHEPKDLPEGNKDLVWDLGLPETKMGDDHSLDISVKGLPKFYIPFKTKDETFHLIVFIQKF